jgi:hypothetical protein
VFHSRSLLKVRSKCASRQNYLSRYSYSSMAYGVKLVKREKRARKNLAPQMNVVKFTVQSLRLGKLTTNGNLKLAGCAQVLQLEE